jgi:hypothetical protein
MEINKSNLLRVANAIQRKNFFLKNIKKLVFWAEAESYCENYNDDFLDVKQESCGEPSPLEKYFENHLEGPGIWKWLHYFDIYHRHLKKFIGQEVNILEVGIYSGGSLGMWKEYFGAKCHIYGIDIEPACKCYEDSQTTVLIGDQEDRNFWKKAKNSMPPVDIIIDDGGHMPNQQKVTLEETLPHIKPGGVYICEDIHGDDNSFSAYATGYVRHLNKFDLERLTNFQRSIHSMHFYPFITVIEKHGTRPDKFVSSKRGTLWQPFFKEGA